MFRPTFDVDPASILFNLPDYRVVSVRPAVGDEPRHVFGDGAQHLRQRDAGGDGLADLEARERIQPTVEAGTALDGIPLGTPVAQRGVEVTLVDCTAPHIAEVFLRSSVGVNDALAGVQYIRQQLAADEDTVKAESRRLELSQMRYEGGVSDYSDVLDAQRYLFSAQLTAVQTRNSLLNATVQLYKALGGGWQEDKPAPPTETAP